MNRSAVDGVATLYAVEVLCRPCIRMNAGSPDAGNAVTIRTFAWHLHTGTVAHEHWVLGSQQSSHRSIAPSCLNSLEVVDPFV